MRMEFSMQCYHSQLILIAALTGGIVNKFKYVQAGNVNPSDTALCYNLRIIIQIPFFFNLQR